MMRLLPVLALITTLGCAVLGPSGEERGELDVLRKQVEALEKSQAELRARVDELAGKKARRAGPDPKRRYAVETQGAPSRGPDSAEVTIVEFGDFQCPFCGRVTPTLDQIEKRYGDRVRIVFKHLPLTIHPKALAAHAAAEAAHRQGRFWEMHDAIFAKQRELEPAKLAEHARQLGLDMEKFQADLSSPELMDRIDADAAEARGLGVTGTPAFFVNGLFLSGAQPFRAFRRVIDQELRAAERVKGEGAPRP